MVSAYEAGRRQPSLPTLAKLVAATGHELDLDLVPDVDPGPTSGPLTGPVGRRVGRCRQQARNLLESRGVVDARLFGSVARGDDRPDSDVDLLVTLPPGSGLFALGRLAQDLEGLIGAPVDVIPSDGLKPDVRGRIERDALPL